MRRVDRRAVYRTTLGKFKTLVIRWEPSVTVTQIIIIILGLVYVLTQVLGD